MFRRLLQIKVLGIGLVAGGIIFGAGIVFWGGFNTGMEATNTLGFCKSCHDMRTTVFVEYALTGHYENRTGVRATCSDCHIPDPWVYKFIRKIRATNELFHWMMGSINTPEKFEAKRLTLAKNVWQAMKETDSRECRNCHSWDGMSAANQKPRAAKQHADAKEENSTCIDCHKGVAHRAIHKILPDDYSFYDGKPDSRFKLAVASAEQLKTEIAAQRGLTLPPPAAAPASAPAAAQVRTPVPAPAAAAAAGGPVDWAKAPGFDAVLFYPGQASIEWLLKGTDHGGGRNIRRKNERCFECHGKEAAEMGQKIVTGSKAETTPIPGKRGHVPVNIRAAHDGHNLYLRFQWPDAPHTPAPFAPGGKMDPENQVKLAMMVSGEGVDLGPIAGCWVSCHHDSRTMPDTPKADALAQAAVKDRLDLSAGVTKYLGDTRTALEISDSPRGGWDKLKPAAEIAAQKQKGAFMDLARFRSGGTPESGHVLEQRVMSGGQPVLFQGGLANGVWTVTMTRPLKAEKPGYASFEPGKLYTVTFAIHDDYTAARFHHVSLDLLLGLDNPGAQINAVKQ